MIKTHYSLYSIGTPEKFAKKAKELGFKQLIISDPNLNGAVSFYKACKKYEIQPVIGYMGEELYVARNKSEYKELLYSISEKRIPKTLTIAGLPFGKMSSLVIKDYINLKLDEDAYQKAKEYIASINPDALGYSNQDIPYCRVLKDLVTDLSKDLGIRLLHLPECFYCSETEDNKSDQLLIASNRAKLLISDMDESDDHLKRFCYYSYPLIQSDHIEVEDYEIMSKPKLPKFGEDPDGELTNLCRDGWRKKVKVKRGDPLYSKYESRVKSELEVIKDWGLSSYFLIVRDILEWVRSNGWLTGTSRGSAGGCLVSYLLDIVKIDAIEHNLLFERFLNPERKGSLPDIDSDVPKSKRGQVLDYIKNKYGVDSVCQMVTFMEFQGRSAIKTVLRNHKVCDFDTMNLITESIPEKAKVEDQMEMAEQKSLIMWTLEYMPERLHQWARIQDNEIVGEYADYFKQAIRIEGLINDTGKHASAVIVYDGKIKDVCPMIEDKSGDGLIAGFSMEDGEAVGLVKLDLLGLSTLDRLMEVNNFLQGGYVNHGGN